MVTSGGIVAGAVGVVQFFGGAAPLPISGVTKQETGGQRQLKRSNIEGTLAIRPPSFTIEEQEGTLNGRTE
jgi:hypothetical protein